MLIKNTQSTSKCWKPDGGYLQVLISVHLGHVEVPFQLPQILYPLSAHTQAQDCSHPFQWPFKHTCSLHTHRHKTAVIHSSGHSNTHALCTHTQAQDSSHPFHSHSSTSAFCTHRHKTAVIYSNGHSDTHALCTHKHLLSA